MFTFLHIQNLIGSLFMTYPLQLFLVGILLILGLYQLYLFIRVDKGWEKR